MSNQVDSTEARLVQTAMRLFSEKGYGATSVADILKEADANSGSLYHFFPTKQDLLLKVLRTYRDGIVPMLIGPAWKGVDDPIERIFALLGSYRRALVATDCTYGCPIGSLALELHEPDPPVRELLALNFNAWVGQVEECLVAARKQFARGFDPAAHATFVLAVMEGAVMQARTHRDLAPFDAAVACLRAHFTALRKPSRRLGRSASARGR